MNLIRKKLYQRLLPLILICFVTTLSVNAQNININFKDTPIKSILKEITRQSGYTFVYSDLLKEVENKITINYTKKNEGIEPLIKQIFSGTKVTWSIIGKQIALVSGFKEENRSSGSFLLKGIVRDDLNEPVPGVTIQNKATGKVTISGIDGSYNIEAKEGDQILFAFMGMADYVLSVGKSNSVNILLKPDVIDLKDVVVTGYQTISRERVTGAYNLVKSEVIERSHSSNLSSALLGTVAGMQGKENADGSIDYTIRGITSLYANANPLVVVDGFPVINGFKDINPNDVESVTVLKDAAAASIWGARSANGVIVVTTKGGRTAKADKFNISISAMTRIGEKVDLSTALTTASATDQVAWERMAYENKWYSNSYSDSFSHISAPYSLAKELLFQEKSGKITKEQMNAGLKKLSESDNRQQIKDYLLQNPVLQQYNFTISSSGTRMQNYVSLLYEYGQGNVVNNGQNRWRLNYNTQASVFNWLDFTFAANLHYLNSNNSGPTMSEIRELSPYELILNDDGSYGTQLKGVNREQYAKIKGTLPYEDWDYNILRETRARELTSLELNSRFQAGLTLKIVKGITFETGLQYEYNIRKTSNYQKEDSYFVRDWVNFMVDYNQTTKTVNKQFIPKGGILQTSDGSDRNYTWRSQVNFNRTFNNKHVITALAGTEISEFQSEGVRNPWVWGYNDQTNRIAPLPFGGRTITNVIQLKNILGSNISQLDNAFWVVDNTNSRQRTDTNTDAASFSYRNDRYVSAYGNFSYTYDNKYNISLSARSDASNLITDNPKYRWAPLWSIGGLWHATREDFMQSASDWLNRLSLRLTYGFNGNVEKSTSPLTLISMGSTPSSNTGTYTGSISNYGNPLLRWERTATTNFGVDFALFNHLLFGSIDVYNKNGKDILGQIAQPAMYGTSTQRVNQAGISNKGIEVELGANTRLGKSGITLNSKIIYAYNQNKVTSLYSPSIQTSTATYGSAFVEGYPVGAVWSYVYDGMKDNLPYILRNNGQAYPMTGTAVVMANIGDGYVEYSGPGKSPHSAGWLGTISGYGFSFSFRFVGEFGGHFRRPSFSQTQLGIGKDVISMFVSDVINGSSDIPSWPAPNAPDFSSWSYYSPYLNTLVESSSFIKLKELNLEYKLPKKLTNSMKMSSASVYAQLRDLGCLWVANSRNYDPEWLPGALPPTTSFVFGLNINF